MHGLGNDFIILDYFYDHSEIDAIDHSELARKLCHRQFGVGGDGLVMVLPSERAAVRMRIFNPDGSEPEMCGNGIRCLARYAYDQGYVLESPLTVETLAGILTLQLTLTVGEVTGIRVDMGEPVLEPTEIPVLATGEQAVAQTLSVEDTAFTFTAVSMGNPHCVIFLEDWEGLDFYRFGPLLEKHERFPHKTNVEFIKVEAPDELTMKVWERGAGPTLACGTGACAALVASVLNGKTERRATVHLPGGDLFIEWGADNHVYMTGPAAYAFRGTWLKSGVRRQESGT